MQPHETSTIAIPLPDLAGGGFFCLLSTGWLFVNDAGPLQALALAAATAICFWAPLRLMDALHHRHVRPNGVFALMCLAASPPARSRWETGSAAADQA